MTVVISSSFLPLVTLVGLVAGVINTFAGGGGFIVLPTLIGLGLRPEVANGTMRVGLLLQNSSAVFAFHQRGLSDIATTWRLALPTTMGAIAGAYLATHTPSDWLRSVVGWAFLAWAIVLLIRPGRFLESPEAPRPLTPLTFLLSFLVGGYGGYLQAGVGLPLMALLVNAQGFAPVQANAIKVALVLIYTCAIIPLFAVAKQIALLEGAALAVGMLVGAWLGVRLQSGKRGAAAVRWVVFAMVLVSGALLALFRR